MAIVFALPGGGLTSTGFGAVKGVPAHHPLETAVSYTGIHSPTKAQNSLAMRRIVSAGARAFRLTVAWNTVAPVTRPEHFRALSASDPAYDWTAVDSDVKRLVAHRLTPIISIIDAPSWAFEKGTTIPKPDQLAAFAHAAATRYSGRYEGLPHVRYWQVWLEPNLTPLLSPQLVQGKPVAAVQYRRMINAFAKVVHAAAPGNLVIAGGTAPFRDITPSVMKQNKDWGPLSFTRAVLCMSAEDKPTCKAHVAVDIWAHHPYTSGGPTHHADLPNDVSLGDLGKLNSLLRAAVRVGHIQSHGQLQLWVTEFSWDTRPPDPGGVPAALATRWVAQALYEMWRNGVSLVTWLQLRDAPMSNYVQAGLYYLGATPAQDRPKPLLRAFRFPVVAFRDGTGVYVWGRTPAGTPGVVSIQERIGSRWRTISRLRTDHFGIFERILRAPQKGSVRARFGGSLSAPFSLKTVPDHGYNPFGAQQSSQPAGHEG